MKNIKIILMLFLSGAIITACEKDEESADVSRLTEYPTFNMEGSSLMHVELGGEYEEPGVTATEGGAQLDVTTSVVGEYTGNNSLDVNEADLYTITYRATNADGFAGSVQRLVYVGPIGDLENSIAGLYTATVVRDGVVDPVYNDLEYVLIFDNGDGTYDLTDAIGLYYAEGRAYGPAYLAPATVEAIDIPSNNFSYSPFTVGTFGGEATMSNMVVDPEANTISFTSAWNAGTVIYTFEVVLTQVQF